MQKTLENKYFQLVVLLFLIVLLFINNGNVSYWDQDEAAYAGFALKMIETKNWLIPDFYWAEIHRKTPLHFWNIIVSYKIFGVNEFAVRFSSALSVALVYLIVYFFTRKLTQNRQVGFYALLVLATSLYIPVLAKVAVTDATLLLLSTLCAIALYFILETKAFKWTLLFWTSFALALLTKGPPIIIFTTILVILLAVLSPNRKNLIRLHPWFFLPIAFFPLGYWVYLCIQSDGGAFINWLVDWYILKRVNGSVLGQTGPPGTHFLLILVVFLPYFMFLPKSFQNGYKGLIKRDPIDLFLAAWFIAGWFFYEFSPSKLPAYVVVAHVPLAILIGRTIANFELEKPKRFWFMLQFILTSSIYLGLIVVGFFIVLPKQLQLYATLLGGVLLVLNCLTFFVFNQSKFIKSLFSINLFFQFFIWTFLIVPVEDLKNAPKKIATYIDKNAKPNSEICIANDFGHPPSLPFYLYLHFKTITFEKDTLKLWQDYKDTKVNKVFILDKNQKDYFLKKENNLHFTSFEAFFTDRKECSNYYVLFNY
jgi:4-amino-4-deoxy-L-arabinose transferase-like glycosyltransferase